VKRNTPLSPNLRANVEQFIQTLKFECLNKFVIVASNISTTCAESGVGITTKKNHIHLAIICRRISLRHLQKAVQSV
jgi:putative transposase